jgi:hypothetical protein
MPFNHHHWRTYRRLVLKVLRLHQEMKKDKISPELFSPPVKSSGENYARTFAVKAFFLLPGALSALEERPWL